MLQCFIPQKDRRCLTKHFESEKDLELNTARTKIVQVIMKILRHMKIAGTLFILLIQIICSYFYQMKLTGKNVLVQKVDILGLVCKIEQSKITRRTFKCEQFLHRWTVAALIAMGDETQNMCIFCLCVNHMIVLKHVRCCQLKDNLQRKRHTVVLYA